VGSYEELFTDEACEIIANESRGIPRTINIICDTALVYGFAGGAQKIAAELVKAVIQNKAQFGVLPFGLQAV
jgi:type II secretory pathway predicted ATPase ExeA